MYYDYEYVIFFFMLANSKGMKNDMDAYKY